MVAVMTVNAQREFRASMPCLPDATAFVAAFCTAHGVAPDDTLRLTLIVEELFTNTVHHGHGGNSAATVRLTLGATAGQIELQYEDSAPAFDPSAQVIQAQADLDAAVAGRAAGGLGITLVAQMASSLVYEREDGVNRIRLSVPRRGAVD
jgi:serine/threonine-protein kinase RsbW